jgi:hypothetical protein
MASVLSPDDDREVWAVNEVGDRKRIRGVVQQTDRHQVAGDAVKPCIVT